MNNYYTYAYLREDGKKGGYITSQIHKENKSGIYSFTKQQLSENGKKGGKKVSSQRWQCLETGFTTNAGNLTKYQKARGIDTSKRVRIS